MLTHKQAECLAFIDRRLAADGASPSFQEIADAIGVRSKGGVHRLLTGLEERGYIRRLKHRARAIEVLKRPPASTIAMAGSHSPEAEQRWRRFLTATIVYDLFPDDSSRTLLLGLYEDYGVACGLSLDEARHLRDRLDAINAWASKDTDALRIKPGMTRQ